MSPASKPRHDTTRYRTIRKPSAASGRRSCTAITRFSRVHLAAGASRPRSECGGDACGQTTGTELHHTVRGLAIWQRYLDRRKPRGSPTEVRGIGTCDAGSRLSDASYTSATRQRSRAADAQWVSLRDGFVFVFGCQFLAAKDGCEQSACDVPGTPADPSLLARRFVFRATADRRPHATSEVQRSARD